MTQTKVCIGRAWLVCATLLALSLLSACASGKASRDEGLTSAPSVSVVAKPPSSSAATEDTQLSSQSPSEQAEAVPDVYKLEPLSIASSQPTGRLQDSQLSEVSGLTASLAHAGLLYAINDSGNTPVLFAIDETGRLLHQWDIDARNRDWEDLTLMQLDGVSYVVIGDTGDNLRQHSSASLILIEEPQWPPTQDQLSPAYTVQFTYEGGPSNVEAFSAIGDTVYLLSKEPVTALGALPNGVFELTLTKLTTQSASTDYIARRIATMPTRTTGIESTLAATFAGVNLNHPTALEFDASGSSAYVLTYREVLQIARGRNQTWAEAFAAKANRLESHSLKQAEALTLYPGRAIWFTSESVGSPVRAISLAGPS